MPPFFIFTIIINEKLLKCTTFAENITTMTFREAIYFVVDTVKNFNDDATLNEDHILFLLSKYRGYLLRQLYSSLKKIIPESNYLTICVDLKDFNTHICGSKYMRISIPSIPYIMTIGEKIVSPLMDFSSGRITLINPREFKYVGNNKFLRNDAYATISLEDLKLYFKSDNDNFAYLKKLRVTALFEDIIEAAKLDCECDCNLLDKRFPLEENFCATLVKVVAQDILSAMYNTKDDANNANDDLAELGNLIQNYTNNRFKTLMRGNNNQQQSQEELSE